MISLNREDYLTLMKSKVTNKNLQKHMLATEAILRDLAPRFSGEIEEWGLAGLLHDIDYENTATNPEKHGIEGVEFLSQYELPKYVLDAISRHPGQDKLLTNLDQALYAADPLTGLIVACALIHPTKKLNAIDTLFIRNRFNEKSFAKGASREQISSCHLLGLELEEFISLGLAAMQGIATELGL